VFIAGSLVSSQYEREVAKGEKTGAVKLTLHLPSKLIFSSCLHARSLS
jgi:hypothetical protein